MDFRNRCYFLVHLNQNYRKSGWWSRGWDNYGWIYQTNLRKILDSGLNGLKLTSDHQSNTWSYHMKVGCSLEDRDKLIELLDGMEQCDYVEMGPNAATIYSGYNNGEAQHNV